jgi:N-acyl-D-aspartate/D-glutamate deacylase
MVAKALEPGAVGFSTSRVLEHQSVDGNQVPGTFAPDDELIAIADSIRRAGRGVLQVIPAGSIGAELNPDSAGLLDHDRKLICHLSISGVPVVFCLFQPNDLPDEWRDALRQCEEITAGGGIIHGMVPPRPISILSCWEGFHPFARRPSYVKIEDLPLEERVKQLRRPEVKFAILAESDLPPRSNTLTDTYHLLLQRILPTQFVFANDPNFEPVAEECIEGLSRRTGKSIEECAYDAMMEEDGAGLLVAMSSYALRGDHEDIREMLAHPNVLPGLSDGGAHVCLICDASLYSFMLSFWSRDRVRGPKIALERVVQLTTQLPAAVYGLADRGTLEAGKRADINVIDFERLRVGHPRMAHDLPLGSKRLLQGASGYVATLVNGVVTRRNDQDTGARPGRLVRNAGHHADLRAAANTGTTSLEGAAR